MAKRYKTNEVRSLQASFLDCMEREAKAFIAKTLSYVAQGHPMYYEHRTLNLHDSYGYGIFLDGELLRHGGVEPKASEPRIIDGHVLWGRDVLKELFNGTNRTTSQGYVVMIAAAMPYAVDLETQYKYRVISFMEQDAMQFGKSLFGKPLVSKVNIREYEAV